MDPDRPNNNEAGRKKKPMERIDSDNPEEMESVAESPQPAMRIRARPSVSEEPTKKSMFNHPILDPTDPREPESSETQATARMEDTNRPPSDTPNANQQSSRGTHGTRGHSTIFNHEMLEMTDPGEPASSGTQATVQMEDTNHPPSDTPNANRQ